MKKPKAVSTGYASLADVEVAIGQLSPADGERLMRYAQLKAAGLRGLGFGVDAPDLLQEAMARTVAGSKKWAKQMPFVGHLIVAMRNLSGHLVRDAQGVRVVSSDPPDDESAASQWSSEWTPRFQARTAEQIAADRERLDRVRERFKGDRRVLEVMDGLEAEMTGPEIKEVLGIDQTQLETAMTRLRRGAPSEEDQP